MAGPDLRPLTHCESRGRTSHVHWDGAEVQREFYVTPFAQAPHVCAALLGFVLKVGSQEFKRYLPAFDPYYDQILYCNEAKWDSRDKKEISASQAVRGEILNLSQESSYWMLMNRLNAIAEMHYVQKGPKDAFELGAGGAFVNASYRPMISGYHPTLSNDATPDAIYKARARQFDFMEPLTTPGSETIPWPLGIMYRWSYPGGFLTEKPYQPVPAESAKPITVSVNEFTMRRMFLGNVPTARFADIMGTINHAAWPAGDQTAPDWQWTFAQFPPETLRLEGYEVITHWSPLSHNNQWFEVVFHFLHRNKYDTVYDKDAKRLDKGAVTWNHTFIRPSNAHAAWYRMFRNEPGGLYEPLYNTSQFDRLFAPVFPHTPT